MFIQLHVNNMYAGILMIIFFLCYAEDSSYPSKPDEWYVIKPFHITQKILMASKSSSRSINTQKRTLVNIQPC